MASERATTHHHSCDCCLGWEKELGWDEGLGMEGRDDVTERRDACSHACRDGWSASMECRGT